MPYCRRCGTKLDEDAHFCHKCGTLVISYPVQVPFAPVRPLRKDPVVIAAIALVAILVSAVIIVAFLVAPVSPWSIGRSLEDDTPDVNTLNLNFETNIGRIDITPLKIDNNNIGIYIEANGSKGMLGGNGTPVSISFDNRTMGDVLTVNSRVSVENRFASQANVGVKIFVDPALNLNLTVTSQAGQVSLTADKDATFNYLNLQSSAGAVQANLQNVTVAGNVTLKTQAGTVDFRMSQAKVEGNNTVTLQTNAGSVDMDITETKTLQGNLQVNAVSELGSINLGLTIDDGVGAKITSQTNLGNIHVTEQNFSGDQSPIQSDNYPAASNIEVNNRTNLGSININAVSQSSTGPSIKN